MVPPRILLVNEPFALGHTETDLLRNAPPLALQVLAGALGGAGFEAQALDLTRSFSPRGDVDRAVEQFRPDIVGFSAARAVNAHAVRALARHVRREHPGVHRVAGGQMATFDPGFFLDDDGVQVVVLGEGERALAELVPLLLAGESLEGRPGLAVRGRNGPQVGPLRPPIEDLDGLPRPDRSAGFPSFFRDGETAAIETVRGCPMGCRHCPIPAFQQHTSRARSVDSVLAELEQLHGDGVTELMIYDQCFGTHPAAARALVEGILRRGLRFHIFAQTRSGLAVNDRDLWSGLVEAGLYSLLLYFDSNAGEVVGPTRCASAREEQSFARQLRRDGVLVIGMGLVAAPGQSPADDLRTAAAHYPISDVYSPTIYTPFVGSPAHQELAEQDRLAVDSYRDFNYVKYVVDDHRNPKLVSGLALGVRLANHLLPLKPAMALLPGRGNQRELLRREYRGFSRMLEFALRRKNP